MLGRFIRDRKLRDRIVITTKFSYNSRPETRFPYTFFEPSLQGMLNGGATVGDKPVSFNKPVWVEGAGAGVTEA